LSDPERIRELAKVDPLAEKIVHVLDRLFRIPGTEIRFGLDPILGLVFPGFGDAASGLFGFYVVFAALRRGVPIPVVFQMIGNLALDAIGGAFPVVGDVFDFAFKANERNLVLLQEQILPGGDASGKPAGPLAWAAVSIGVVGALGIVALPLLAVLWGLWRCSR
jgi:hypothetical protein